MIFFLKAGFFFSAMVLETLPALGKLPKSSGIGPRRKTMDMLASLIHPLTQDIRWDHVKFFFSHWKDSILLLGIFCIVIGWGMFLLGDPQRENTKRLNLFPSKMLVRLPIFLSLFWTLYILLLLVFLAFQGKIDLLFLGYIFLLFLPVGILWLLYFFLHFLVHEFKWILHFLKRKRKKPS